MSYYDFEHFWSSHELCQSQQNLNPKESLLDTIVGLFNQIYRELFPRQTVQSDKQNKD
ncbi:hypothetical protein Sta7437_3778 [Stanieria cyanosphaera PCC 7437]|uniref:Uncharacterized protein n=1 Tax=Stanieria cyanosphaera (strain ATCC 29371 / PCC 7437) TaxID=111780 RepID=K9XXE4_STAC7|nr:hypothetical protein [Stanieria cyanosphaera]AFZ37270.1 hypothetical protein Sta7437_3778 [Stanieria cyanosphaera PCC 7437]